MTLLKVFLIYLTSTGGMLDFSFGFNCTVVLSKMKSLFFNLSTSPNVTNLSIDYCGQNFDNQFECTRVHSTELTKLKNTQPINIDSFLNCLCSLNSLIMTIIWFLLLPTKISKAFETVFLYLTTYTLENWKSKSFVIGFIKMK